MGFARTFFGLTSKMSPARILWPRPMVGWKKYSETVGMTCFLMKALSSFWRFRYRIWSVVDCEHMEYVM